MMKQRVVTVTEFKAKCLSLLNEIGEHGGTITITKRGKPLAKVSPARKPVWKSLEGIMAGKLDYDDATFNEERRKIWEPFLENAGIKD
ncbi:MAG: prevent-host-death family protein [Candidatus Solibacter sp.]|jgi:prevent-host-death family protein|nr:prevent-host-death family protein [Candidatus Solibacter sp.]